jgi:hypothetical protein
MIKHIIFAGLVACAAPVAAFAQAVPTPVPATPAVPAAPAAPAATAPAAAPAPAAKTTESKQTAKGAGAARRKQCSEEYQAAKKANTLGGQIWPKFYSACNTRLKAAGQ